MHISMVPNSKILFSNYSKKNLVCPENENGETTVNAVVDVGQICQDDISCTMFEKIDFPFKFRSEQCAENLYILMIYPEAGAGDNSVMSIGAQFIDQQPCFTVTGGVHEIVNTDTQCGERSATSCEETVR